MTVLLIVLYLYFSSFDRNIFVYYLIATPPVLIVTPPLLLAIYLSYQKYRYVWLSWAVVGVYMAFISTAMHSPATIVPLSQPAIDTQAANHIRICSWNTRYFFEWGRDNGFKTLQEKDCSFIFLQEVWKSDTVQQELTLLRDTYLKNYDFVSNGEFVIFYPKNSIVTKQKSTTQAFLNIETRYKEKQLSLISVHLWNPIVARPEESAGKTVYIDAKQDREKQEDEILPFVQKEAATHTVFMLGDFNSTENTPILSQIEKAGSLKVASESILKRNATYPVSFPLIRIDYAFTSQKLENKLHLETECLPKTSDHCLMILDVLL